MNSSNSSGNFSSSLHAMTTSLKAGMTSAYVIIFIVGLLGNSIGFYIVYKKSTSRSVANLLIANLAIADLLVTLSIVPYSVIHMYIGNLWFNGIFGHATCTIIMFSFVVTIAASIFTILVVAIDRFYAIFYPLRGRLFRKPKIMSVIIWVSSVIIMSPYFLIWRTFKGQDGRSYCFQVWYWEHDTIYFTQTRYILKILNILIFVFLYIIPLLITASLYIMIGVRMWMRRIPGNITESIREAQGRSKRKVIKLLSIIIIVFALFWIPTHVMHYYIFIKPDQLVKIPATVQYLSFWFTHVQSSINPCLYILLNGSFREEFVKTFKLCSFLERQARRIAGSLRESHSSSVSLVRSMRSFMSLGRSTEYDLPRSTRSVSCSRVVSRTSFRKVTREETTL